MTATLQITNWVLRRVFQALCRIDGHELKKVPRNGPLILVGNHINFLEVPVVMPHLNNPNITGLAKVETWKNPLFNFLFNQWGAIPIDRGAVDHKAFRLSLEALAQGKILAVSPEGTRSKTGCLVRAKSGVVALARRSQAPLMPVVFFGHENFWQNFKHLRRTDFHIRAGQTFRIRFPEGTPGKEVRQAIADEIMYRIAELLPEQYHGDYADVNTVAYRYTYRA
ncbi:MAG TPA: lysophospholipid acyltransferase family protein [Levilinea sp.]|nr:lysophospholipid acyltransferase family protein [Levilinea sp.]